MSQGVVPFYALWYEGSLISDRQYETLDEAAHMAGFLLADITAVCDTPATIHVLMCVGAVRGARVPPSELN